jgi:multidrug efflux pump subunit AcrA (membrane-fusion protein)
VIFSGHQPGRSPPGKPRPPSSSRHELLPPPFPPIRFYPAAPAPAPRDRRPAPPAAVGRILGGTAALVLAVGAGLGGYLHYAAGFESTDDSFLEGNVHPVSPRINGTVARVLVDDNAHVEAGQPLVELDPADLNLAVQGAEADLAQARANADAGRRRRSPAPRPTSRPPRRASRRTPRNSPGPRARFSPHGDPRQRQGGRDFPAGIRCVRATRDAAQAAQQSLQAEQRLRRGRPRRRAGPARRRRRPDPEGRAPRSPPRGCRPATPSSAPRAPAASPRRASRSASASSRASRSCRS